MGKNYLPPTTAFMFKKENKNRKRKRKFKCNSVESSLQGVK